MAEIGHVGGGGIGVDGPADEGQAARLSVRVFLGQIGCGGECERRGLADGNDMSVRPEELHEVGEVKGVVLDVELAL